MSSFCDRGGQGWAEPRACRKGRETRCAGKRRLSCGQRKTRTSSVWSGSGRILIHVDTPDRTTELSRQGVVDSAGQQLETVRQQKSKDAVAELIEIPAGLAEETMKGAKVFVAAQLPGLNRAGKRTPAGTKNPGAGHCPKGEEAGWSKTKLKGEQQRSKGEDHQLGHRRPLIFQL